MPVNVGSYSVTATVTDPHYVGSATGILVITPAPAGVTLGSLDQVYDGSGKAVDVTTSPPGLSVSVTYAGSASLPVDVGSYAVEVAVTAPNYAGSASGTLVISPAPAVVTLGSLSHVYDGSEKAATATTAPSGLAVSFAYDP